MNDTTPQPQSAGEALHAQSQSHEIPWADLSDFAQQRREAMAQAAIQWHQSHLAASREGKGSEDTVRLDWLSANRNTLHWSHREDVRKQIDREMNEAKQDLGPLPSAPEPEKASAWVPRFKVGDRVAWNEQPGIAHVIDEEAQREGGRCGVYREDVPSRKKHFYERELVKLEPLPTPPADPQEEVKSQTEKWFLTNPPTLEGHKSRTDSILDELRPLIDKLLSLP